MLRRTRTLKSGAIWEGFYYNGRDAAGKRVEIPLGSDIHEAKRKWAELECVEAPPNTSLMEYVFNRYIKEILPTKAASTQRDNTDALKNLRPVFDKAPIDGITPQAIAQYRDKRSAKVRANREITLLSHVFNMAREWGFTAKENPCKGVRKNKEAPRDFYADAEVWDAVYAQASIELQDAMDVAYLTGQRPSDVRKLMVTDIRDNALHVRQGKTKKYLRIQLETDGVQSELGQVLDRIAKRPGKIRSLYVVATPNGQPLTRSILRRRFDTARAAAVKAATEAGKESLAGRLRNFQFRDSRAKAASEIVDVLQASKLLGHTEQKITKDVYRRVGEAVKPTR